jgi:uncharacterized protein
MDSAAEDRDRLPLDGPARTIGSPIGGETPFERFIAPAGACPDLWRLLLGCIIIVATWLATSLLLPAGMTLLRRWVPPDAAFALVVLYVFAGLIAGTALAVRLLHHRAPASLIGPGGFRLRRFALAAMGLFGLSVIGGTVLFTVYPVTAGLSPDLWFALLPVALLGVFIQCAAEEIVFRGYLLQTLAARFRWRAVWLGVPAVLFGAMHWDPATHGPNAWLIVLSAGLVGLFLGDVTARHGDLSPAMGLHFANNVVALLIFTAEGPLAGLGLFRVGVDPADTEGMRMLLVLDILLTLLAYGIWLVVWGRRRRLHSIRVTPIKIGTRVRNPTGS